MEWVAISLYIFEVRDIVWSDSAELTDRLTRSTQGRAIRAAGVHLSALIPDMQLIHVIC